MAQLPDCVTQAGIYADFYPQMDTNNPHIDTNSLCEFVDCLEHSERRFFDPQMITNEKQMDTDY